MDDTIGFFDSGLWQGEFGIQPASVGQERLGSAALEKRAGNLPFRLLLDQVGNGTFELPSIPHGG
jgi:hypothetical protein